MLKFTNHAFKGFDEDLKKLHNFLLAMRDNIHTQLDYVEMGAKSSPVELETARELDRAVNLLEFSVDTHVAQMIMKYNLVGDEMRFILSALKIAALLERVADLAKNCVKRVSRIKADILQISLEPLSILIHKVQGMLRDSIALIIDYDLKEVESLSKKEDEVDETYRKLLKIADIHGSDVNKPFVMHLFLLAKNLERMANLTFDIAKICHFIHNGEKFEKIV